MTLEEYYERGGSERAATFSVEIESTDDRITVHKWCRPKVLVATRVVHLKEFNFSYVQEEGHPGLWTMDDHGNKKSRTVFKVIEV